jgi:hypothetical protein
VITFLLFFLKKFFPITVTLICYLFSFFSFSTPVDSPADPSRFNEPPTQIPNSTHQQLNNNGTIEGTWIHPHPPQAPINNNYGQVMNCVNGLMQNPILVDNGMMFNGNGNTRLPDSPPITDISAGGSSASPSTTSDSPYSPDQYPYCNNLFFPFCKTKFLH